MGLLFWIIFGGLVGWIVSVMSKSEQNHELLFDICLGIFGALIGGLGLNFYERTGISNFNLLNLVTSVVGAGFFIWFGKLFVTI